MNNPRLAARYAKSLVDIATEQQQLTNVYEDMKLIQRICKSNPDFVAVLVSPVIKSDKKGKIIESITNGRVSKISESFIDLLVRKGRENALPEIAGAVGICDIKQPASSAAAKPAASTADSSKRGGDTRKPENKKLK